MKIIIWVCIISLLIGYAAIQTNGFQFIHGEVSIDATLTIWGIIITCYIMGFIGWFLSRREQGSTV